MCLSADWTGTLVLFNFNLPVELNSIVIVFVFLSADWAGSPVHFPVQFFAFYTAHQFWVYFVCLSADWTGSLILPFFTFCSVLPVLCLFDLIGFVSFVRGFFVSSLIEVLLIFCACVPVRRLDWFTCSLTHPPPFFKRFDLSSCLVRVWCSIRVLLTSLLSSSSIETRLNTGG